MCEIRFPINLRNKISFSPKASYISKRYASNYIGADKEEMLIVFSPQFHADLDILYNYTKNTGAYIQLNNITNSRKELWEGYREIGFNLVFGLHYSF